MQNKAKNQKRKWRKEEKEKEKQNRRDKQPKAEVRIQSVNPMPPLTKPNPEFKTILNDTRLTTVKPFPFQNKRKKEKHNTPIKTPYFHLNKSIKSYESVSDRLELFWPWIRALEALFVFRFRLFGFRVLGLGIARGREIRRQSVAIDRLQV
jgi:hypothetical protein